MNKRLEFVVPDHTEIEEDKIELTIKDNEKIIDLSTFLKQINKTKVELCIECLMQLQIEIYKEIETIISCNEVTKNNKDNFRLINIYNQKKMTGNLVGIYRNNGIDIFGKKYDVILTIRSRLDNDNKCYFLSKMLFNNLQSNNPRVKLNDENIPISTEELFDFVLVSLFLRQLIDSSSHGLYRKYTRKEKNDYNFKGSLDISRHIKLNAFTCNGKIAHIYNENTFDNSLNHLILLALDTIRKKYSSLSKRCLKVNFDLRKIENEIIIKCPSYGCVTIRSLIKKNIKKITHPYFHQYDKVRDLAIKIILRKYLSLFAQSSEFYSYGILYYVPDLWENYIESLLKSIEHNNKNIRIAVQEERKYLGVLRSRPDYVISKDNKEIAILDAKFKPNWEIYTHSEDITKCIRDMFLFKTDKIGVIFPKYLRQKEKNDFESKPKLIIEDDEKYKFYEFGILIPSSEELNFEAWNKKLSIEEDNFIDYIEKMIKET